jgi:hypothetical protein
MQENPSGLLILKEFGDKLSSWLRPTSPCGMVPSILKDVYGINAGGSYMPSNYSDRSKDIPAIYNPAISVLAEGTRDQVLSAFGAYGKSDGFIGRWLAVECGKNLVKNNVTQPILPEAMVTKFRDMVTYCVGNGLPSAPVTVGATKEAEAILLSFQDEEDAVKEGDQDNPQMAFWRAAFQNACKLATVMAIHENYLNPVVTVAFAEWAVAFTRYSIANMSAHDQEESAYADPISQVASVLKMKIKQYMAGSGGSVHAQSLRAEGIFKIGYLPNLKRHNAVNNFIGGSNKAVAEGLRSLELEGLIEVVQGSVKFTGCPPMYRLGDMWGVEH